MKKKSKTVLSEKGEDKKPDGNELQLNLEESGENSHSSNEREKSDTMSLDETSGSYGNVEYICIDIKLLVVSEEDNPLIAFKKSKKFLDMLKIARMEYLQRKIDQFIPLIVKKVLSSNGNGFEYRYVGDLESLTAVGEYLEEIGRKEVWCVVVAPNVSDDDISKLWSELNLSNPIPDPVYRLYLYRHHIKKNGFSKRQLKHFLGISATNGKEAKQIDRDYSICSSDVLYELVTGISKLDEENTFDEKMGVRRISPPDSMKSKITYSQGLIVAETLGDKKEVHEEFITNLNLWIDDARKMELKSDLAKPIFERLWYVKSKPYEISSGIAGRSVLPSKLNRMTSFWPARLIDENNRILKIPELSIDLKKKDTDNVKLLFDFYFKAASLSQTIKSYLKTISPIVHGGVVRGKAAEDDSSLELRSNMSEFYNQRYLKEVFKMNMLLYCDPVGLLASLGLAVKSFGFVSSTKPKKLKEISNDFLEWKSLNHDRFAEPLSLPNVPLDVFSRHNLLKHLSNAMDLYVPADNETELDFESFFHLLMPLVFNEVQKEYGARLMLNGQGDNQ